jgi:NAD(P)-dependent dehydrogenase (short-subunit alcohol dehydrogenase family)
MSNQRIALITGGTDGIGKATARKLLADGWHVVIVGRSAAKCDATVAELKLAFADAQLERLVGDLSLMADVKKVADAFRSSHARLDFLFLNANAISQQRTLTNEGFESNLAIGYFGRALLTWRLEELLKATPGAQILSVVGLNLDRLDFDDVTMEKGFSDMKALGKWQWAMQVFAREFNRRSPVPMNVFMPGLVKTKILANEPQPMRAIVKLANLFIGLPVDRSAAEVAQVVDDIARNGRRDSYYSRTKLKPPRDLKMKSGDGDGLWELTERLLRPFMVTAQG